MLWEYWGFPYTGLKYITGTYDYITPNGLYFISDVLKSITNASEYNPETRHPSAGAPSVNYF